MKFLVTGSNGFVASCIAEAAILRGHEVFRLSRPWADRLESRLDEIVPDVIFHGAGSASVAESIRDPDADYQRSVMPWKMVLEAVRQTGQRPLILFPSSAAVYGNPEHSPVPEDSVLAPISPYGQHKVECERLAQKAREEGGVPVHVFRLFSVHGARQKRLLVRELYEKAQSDTPFIQLAGTGEERRDYISQGDLGKAVLDFAELPVWPTEHWRFNLASGKETSVRELAEMICALLNLEKSIQVSAQGRVGDPARWCANTELFHEVCPAWRPKPLKESLEETLSEWQREDDAR
jgi:UDP-glucose 4-epimerase